MINKQCQMNRIIINNFELTIKIKCLTLNRLKLSVYILSIYQTKTVKMINELCESNYNQQF